MSTTTTYKGLLGTKLGMTQTFDENARVVPVTVLQAGPCTVTQVKSPERDGYAAVQLAYGDVKRGRVTVLNLEVVKADPERNLLLVKGAVPGPKRGLVMLRSSVKGSGARVAQRW